MISPDIIFIDDKRYPGPKAFEVPDHVQGTMSRAELEAHPRIFTWGDLKEIVQSGDIERLSRNKEVQARYTKWMDKQVKRWGSSEDYLIDARLPWGKYNNGATPPPEPEDENGSDKDKKDKSAKGDKDSNGDKAKSDQGNDKKGSKAKGDNKSKDDSKSKNDSKSKDDSKATKDDSNKPKDDQDTKDERKKSDSLKTKYTDGPKKNTHKPGDVSKENDDDDDEDDDDDKGAEDSMAYVALEEVKPRLKDKDDHPDNDTFLKFDPAKGFDTETFAILPNDWPYCLPYGTRHYCIWSKIPIAHPTLVDYDEELWKTIEDNGLHGFTGVTPVIGDKDILDADTDDKEEVMANLNEDGTIAVGDGVGPADETEKGGWYALDVEYAGSDFKRWAGVEFECKGGHEVANMVKGVWDERGWETLWFVNPPRLQSIPGYAHFHIFARRKTPAEIDLSEFAYKEGYKAKKHPNKKVAEKPVEKNRDGKKE